ncbi:hypothetical protein D3C78_1845680 [compost metagenome]
MVKKIADGSNASTMLSCVMMPATASDTVMAVMPRNGTKLERKAKSPHRSGMASPPK